MNLTELKELFFSGIMVIFLAYIAYQQMKTNKSKFRLDLYNKRFEIYKDILKFYQELTGKGISKSTHLKFIDSIYASKFLFSKEPEISGIVDEMHKKSFKIMNFKENEKKYL